MKFIALFEFIVNTFCFSKVYFEIEVTEVYQCDIITFSRNIEYDFELDPLAMDFTINFGQRPIESGDLLLSEPFMKDHNFERAVILICDHDEQKGSFGLILNKPSLVTIEEVESELAIDSPIYVGGPVEQDTLHYVHKFKDIANAIPLKDGLYWGGDYEQIQELNAQGILNNSNCRFFLGYAGWENHQLRGELKEDSWVVTNARLNHILEEPIQDIWQNTLTEMGGKYKVFANAAKNIRLN